MEPSAENGPHPPAPSPTPPPSERERGKTLILPLSPGAVLAYSLANLGFGMFYAFNNAALPLYMKGLTSNAVLLGLLAGTHSFEGAIIQPLVGTWSDRLRSPLGRRRPFLLTFIPLSALFLVLAPFLAAHAPMGTRLPLTVLCVFLFTVLFNVAADPYQALLADITPRAQRGRVTGVWTFVGALGQIAVLLAALPIGVKFVLVAGILLATTLLTCALTREPPAPAPPQHRVSHASELREAVRGLRTLRQARWYLLMFFCYGAGTGAVLPFLTLFIQRITHCTDTQAQQQFVILMATVAVGVVPCGWLADKIGSVRLLFVGMGLMALASLNGLWVTTLPQVACVMALAGLGTAAQNAAAFPLLTRLVPRAEVGFYTGLQTTALSLAGPGAVAITGYLINHSSYRVIFGVCAAFVFGALFALSRLREDAAAVEIQARDTEQGRLAAT